jgi:serine/threonine protein kinase
MDNDANIKQLFQEGGKKQKPVHLLSQGAYGCVFYPGIACNSSKPDSPNFITKIQKSERTTVNEQEISKKITKIRGYSRFFAPIVKQCPVKFTKESNQEMKKCEVFKEESVNPDNVYLSNKIRYVGKNNMRRHLLDKYVSQYASYGSDPRNKPINPPSTKKQANAFFAELVRTHIYLNRGIEQLIKHNIVHNDIRYNNMVYDDKLEVPIFIDFGLSIDMNTLGPETYAKRFYVFDIYPYWSMDVHICNYIFQNVTYPKAETETIKREEIDYLIHSFIYKENEKQKGTFNIGNDVFAINIIDSQVKSFEEKWTKYLSTFTGKTWFDLYRSTIKFFHTWDIYSVCVVNMMVLDDLFMKNRELYKIVYDSMGSELTDYIQAVSRVMYETSDKRPSPEALNKTLKQIQKRLV